MENDKFKEMLMTALLEPEIQNQLRNIVFMNKEPGQDSDAREVRNRAQDLMLQTRMKDLNAEIERIKEILNDERSENARLRQENQCLEEKRRSMEQHCAALREQLLQSEEELKKCKADIETVNKKLKNAELEMMEYRSFDEILTLFREYHSLSPEMLSSASHIIRAESAELFFATGCQSENIFALWDFMKSNWNSLNDSNKHTLLKMIEIFLKTINDQYQRPVYQIMKCKIGDMFDERLHMRTADCSRYSGNIREICLPGILNVYNEEKVIRKSLVIV